MENLEFWQLLFQAWKCLEFTQKVGKPGILTKKLETYKFCVSKFTFQDVIYTKILIYIYI